MLRYPNKARVAVLCSYRAPELEELIARGMEPETSYEVVACMTTEAESTAEAIAARHDITFLRHEIQFMNAGRGAGAVFMPRAMPSWRVRRTRARPCTS